VRDDKWPLGTETCLGVAREFAATPYLGDEKIARVKILLHDLFLTTTSSDDYGVLGRSEFARKIMGLSGYDRHHIE